MSTEAHLVLATRPLVTGVHFAAEAGLPEYRLTKHISVVTDIIDPVTGITHTNPIHSEALGVAAFRAADTELPADGITLGSDKAARFIKVFKSLTPGHQLECHDLVRQVEDWGEDMGMGPNYVHVGDQILPTITSGAAYSVLVGLPTETDGIVRTHSCLGTDSGKLLGIMGRGLMLGIVDVSSTVEVYGRGYPAAVARTMLKAQFETLHLT